MGTRKLAPLLREDSRMGVRSGPLAPSAADDLKIMVTPAISPPREMIGAAWPAIRATTVQLQVQR